MAYYNCLINTHVKLIIGMYRIKIHTEKKNQSPPTYCSLA